MRPQEKLDGWKRGIEMVTAVYSFQMKNDLVACHRFGVQQSLYPQI